MKAFEEKRNMINWRTWGVAFVAASTPMMALAQGVIQAISNTPQGATDVVRIEMSEPLREIPKGFVVQTPPRVAIDLPQVSSSLPQSLVEVNQGNVRAVNVAQTADRTRVVFNLRQAANYRAQIDGKALLIMLDSAPVHVPADTTLNVSSKAEPVAAAVAAPVVTAQPMPTSGPAAPVVMAQAPQTGTARPAPSANFAVPQARDAQGLRDIDFRRGPDGSGRVIVTLPHNQVGVDIRQQGKALAVEFQKSTLPDHLRRRLDVTDFGTAVTSITTTQAGDRVRMMIEPNGLWDHSAYQSDNQFVVEVRRQLVDANKLVKGPGYAGEKLSLNFQSIEVRSLLQVIADFTNFNIVTSDTVGGNLTLRLKDVPWDQALDIILQSKGLGMRRSGNVIWVAPKDELAAKEQAELEASKKKGELEPLRTQSFQLNYTKAIDVAKALSGAASLDTAAGAASRILTPRGSVIADQRTNQLFVTDVPSKLDEIQGLVSKIDSAVRQVVIEARIVEASDTFGKSLGVRLGGTDMRGMRGGVPGWSIGNGDRAAIAGNYDAAGVTTGQSSATSFNNTSFVNLPAVAINGSNPATMALTLFGAASNRFLNLELSALEADGSGKVVASPRVVTADQVKASITQGSKIPYLKATSSGATAVDFIEAAMKLEVTPQITPEGAIILDVKINKDSLGTLTSIGREIRVKEVKTQVLVENGGTVVIGGIYEQSETNSVTKVPLLGDIPFIGNLFKTTSRDSARTELLVFLTPRVLSERALVR